jgi:lysozyme family protein
VSLAGAICDERLRFLQQLRTWPVFGKGWGRRVAEVRATSLAWARDVKAGVAPQEPAPGRAVVPAAKAVKQATAAGAAAAGMAATVHAQQAGAGWGGILVITSATAVVIVAVWLFWRWRESRRQLS